MPDLIEHLPDGADGDLKGRRTRTDLSADQRVDSSVNLLSLRIQVKALGAVTATALEADIPRFQYRPEAFDVHHPVPEVSRNRVMDSTKVLETDSVNELERPHGPAKRSHRVVYRSNGCPLGD